MGKIESNNKLLSVVMSVFNAAPFLNNAIDSILNQTYSDFEFIIVNDGSTDKSLEIIKSYQDGRIILINQQNKGLSKSLNTGIAIAKGEFIVRMDADDLSHPSRIEKQIKFMLENKNCVVLGSNADYIDEKGNFLYKSNLSLEDKDLKTMLPESPFFHSSTMFNKYYFLKSGQYPTEIPQYFEDKILWNKMSIYGTFHNLQDSLIQYRLTPNSISNLSSNKLVRLRSVANTIITNDFIITSTNVKSITSIAKISKNKKHGNYYLRIGSILLKQNKKIEAIKNLLLSLYKNPFQLRTWLKLGLSFLPFFITKYIKQFS